MSVDGAHETVTDVALLATAATFFGTLGAWVSVGPPEPWARTRLSKANVAPDTAVLSDTLTVSESPDVLTV